MSKSAAKLIRMPDLSMRSIRALRECNTVVQGSQVRALESVVNADGGIVDLALVNNDLGMGPGPDGDLAHNMAEEYAGLVVVNPRRFGSKFWAPVETQSSNGGNGRGGSNEANSPKGENHHLLPLSEINWAEAAMLLKEHEARLSPSIREQIVNGLAKAIDEGAEQPFETLVRVIKNAAAAIEGHWQTFAKGEATPQVVEAVKTIEEVIDFVSAEYTALYHFWNATLDNTARKEILRILRRLYDAGVTTPLEAVKEFWNAPGAETALELWINMNLVGKKQVLISKQVDTGRVYEVIKRDGMVAFLQLVQEGIRNVATNIQAVETTASRSTGSADSRIISAGILYSIVGTFEVNESNMLSLAVSLLGAPHGAVLVNCILSGLKLLVSRLELLGEKVKSAQSSLDKWLSVVESIDMEMISKLAERTPEGVKAYGFEISHIKEIGALNAYDSLGYILNGLLHNVTFVTELHRGLQYSTEFVLDLLRSFQTEEEQYLLWLMLDNVNRNHLPQTLLGLDVQEYNRWSQFWMPEPFSLAKDVDKYVRMDSEVRPGISDEGIFDYDNMTFTTSGVAIFRTAMTTFGVDREKYVQLKKEAEKLIGRQKPTKKDRQFWRPRRFIWKVAFQGYLEQRNQKRSLSEDIAQVFLRNYFSEHYNYVVAPLKGMSDSEVGSVLVKLAKEIVDGHYQFPYVAREFLAVAKIESNLQDASAALINSLPQSLQVPLPVWEDVFGRVIIAYALKDDRFGRRERERMLSFLLKPYNFGAYVIGSELGPDALPHPASGLSQQQVAQVKAVILDFKSLHDRVERGFENVPGKAENKIVESDPASGTSVRREREAEISSEQALALFRKWDEKLSDIEMKRLRRYIFVKYNGDTALFVREVVGAMNSGGTVFKEFAAFPMKLYPAALRNFLDQKRPKIERLKMFRGLFRLGQQFADLIAKDNVRLRNYLIDEVLIKKMTRKSALKPEMVWTLFFQMNEAAREEEAEQLLRSQKVTVPEVDEADESLARFNAEAVLFIVTRKTAPELWNGEFAHRMSKMVNIFVGFFEELNAAEAERKKTMIRHLNEQWGEGVSSINAIFDVVEKHTDRKFAGRYDEWGALVDIVEE